MARLRPASLTKKAAFALPFLCLLAAPVSAVAAPAEEHLAPTMPWRVEWAKDSCLLRRAFGTAEDPVLLQLERFAPSDSFQVLLAGSRLDGWDSPEKFSLEYRPNGTVRTLRFYTNGKTVDGVPTILFTAGLAPQPPEGQPYAPVTPDMEAAISSIALVRPGQRIELDTGSLGPVFAQMRRCTDQLVSGWGIDLTRWKTRSRGAKPIGNPGNWLTTNDYPTVAGLSGKQAIVNFRLVVGADGKATGCAVQSSYSGKQFDDLTCRLLMQRAHFVPALDAHGVPMADFYTTSAHWAMPR